MRIMKCICFLRNSETGKIECPQVIYPEGDEVKTLNRTFIWRTEELICGTPEAEQFLIDLNIRLSDENNKRFKLPIHLGHDITVTYDECLTMYHSLYQLSQMDEVEASKQLEDYMSSEV